MFSTKLILLLLFAFNTAVSGNLWDCFENWANQFRIKFIDDAHMVQMYKKVALYVRVITNHHHLKCIVVTCIDSSPRAHHAFASVLCCQPKTASLINMPIKSMMECKRRRSELTPKRVVAFIK